MSRITNFIDGLRFLHEWDLEADIGSEHDIFYFWMSDKKMKTFPAEVVEILEKKYHWYQDKDKPSTFYWYT